LEKDNVTKRIVFLQAEKTNGKIRKSSVTGEKSQSVIIGKIANLNDSVGGYQCFENHDLFVSRRIKDSVDEDSSLSRTERK